MKARKISAGDVFRFNAGSSRYAYGQILLSDILQYVIIFEPRFRNGVELSEAISSLPILSGWTTDAKIQLGDWDIVGHARLIDSVLFPEYKVTSSGKTWVTDVEGHFLRLATAKEAEDLRLKSSSSPSIFEDAFRAYHGDLPWEGWFDKLRAQIIAH